MKKRPSSLREAHIGPSADLDEGVKLNALSGRRIPAPRPLSVGSHSRLRFGTVLYAGTKIGNHFETGHHVVVREQNRIGNQVMIWNNSTIDYGCVVGHRVKIHCNCYIAQNSVLEDDVLIAPGVTFANDLFPKTRHSMRVLQGPIVRKGAIVGVGCTILPAIVIGEGAIIGSGSVVTRDVPPKAVVWGNPARVQKHVSDLRWPREMTLLDKKAKAFYVRQMAGKIAYD